MRAVLGVDAAWTVHQPSGVALAVETANGWELVAAEASYQRFCARADSSMEPEARPRGSTPSATALLSAARALSGSRVDLVAIDMPMSLDPITCRRISDNKVSKAYGREMYCGTHSPNAQRPGLISDQLLVAFSREGYQLQMGEPVATPGLIEVYPHPALMKLAQAPRRIEYKWSKKSRYWRDCSPAERRENLLGKWDSIVGHLEGVVKGSAALLRPPAANASGIEMKACEDAIDAVICAWVAICALEGKACPYGDDRSAIWIPSDLNQR